MRFFHQASTHERLGDAACMQKHGAHLHPAFYDALRYYGAPHCNMPIVGPASGDKDAFPLPMLRQQRGTTSSHALPACASAASVWGSQKVISMAR